jgi:hypothetical protein
VPEKTDKLLPPVFAAMSALDEAIAEHDLLVERLATAMQEGARLDEELRAVDFDDHERLAVATKAMAFAVSMVQRIAWKEEAARKAMEHAQQALVTARKVQSRARSELLRIELEIDAASIWDMVGQFEAKVRGRLEEHAKIAADMNFAAHAAGEESVAALEASTLVPALGTSGPDLWNALAGGVRQLYDRHGAPLPGSTMEPSRADFERPALIAEKVEHKTSEPPYAIPPPPPFDEQPDFELPFAQRVEPLPDYSLPFAQRVAPARAAAAAAEKAPPAAVPAPVVLARATVVPSVTTPSRSTPPVPTRSTMPVKPIPVKPIPARPASAAISRPVPPPPPPDETDEDDAPPRFDFGRPSSASTKSDPPPSTYLARGAPLGRVVSSKADSVPPADENKRGRLDRMLRNLAGMVAPRRAPDRVRRSRDK